VECNKKFGYSADTTLKTIQSLYEKKLTTYPRVDARYLSDDIYPKCQKILQNLILYNRHKEQLDGKPLPKSNRVFNTSKVTDHHAVIPTGEQSNGLSKYEQNVYDLIAMRFISVFMPDCKYATTTVLGDVEGVEFKATGKEILPEGWKAVYGKSAKDDDDDDREEDNTLPSFAKGESGSHRPKVVQKMTTPPKPYTEATLLQAMETAGKMVDNEELRTLMKENGIGRPSSRAGIIETLFRRGYVVRNKNTLVATPVGIRLIDLIKDDILKSPELTGQWEKKLCDIEAGKYTSHQFVAELEEKLRNIVRNEY